MTSLPTASKKKIEYTKCYCEENVYKLVQKLCLHDAPSCKRDIRKFWVVFVSNSNKQVPLWFQGAGDPEYDGLVVWDYHVFLVQGMEEGGSGGQDSTSEALVWDLDSTLPFPTTFGLYAKKALKADERFNAAFTKLYRVIPGASYLDSFASDRGHMKSPAGEWLFPPPSYPPIVAFDGCLNSFHRFLDMTTDCFDAKFGQVLSEQELLQKFGATSSS